MCEPQLQAQAYQNKLEDQYRNFRQRTRQVIRVRIFMIIPIMKKSPTHQSVFYCNLRSSNPFCTACEDVFQNKLIHPLQLLSLSQAWNIY